MAATLASLLDGTISVEDFTQNVIHSSKPDGLTGGPKLKVALEVFVPFFLNYLRESTQHHLASRQTASTPKKPPRKPDKVQGPSQSQDTPSRSSSRGLVFQSYKTPSPSPTQQTYSRRHHGKGHSPASSPSMHRKSPKVTPGSYSGRETSPLVGQSKPSLDSMEEFPPMGAKATPKSKKTTPRRITPTPVKSGQNSPQFPSGYVMSSPSGHDTSLSPASLQDERNMLRFIKSKQQRRGDSPWGNRTSPSPQPRTPPMLSLGDFISPNARSAMGEKLSRKFDEVEVRDTGSSPMDNSKSLTKSESSKNDSSFSVKISEKFQATTSENDKNLDNRNNSKCEDPELEIKEDKVKDGNYSLKEDKKVIVCAEVSKVTQKEKVDVLALVYASLIEGNVVPNLTSEVYFVTQLLTTRVVLPETDKQVMDENILYSVHNCVQFAVIVLENLQRIVTFVDRGTLRLLAENTRISDFSPEFKKWLVQQQEKVTQKNPEVSATSPIGGVPFSADKDNRKTFPSDRAFQNFRKQRDAFYELVREWEDLHAKSGWTMEENMGNKIRQVVRQKPELANHTPFARLFLSQLLQMCKGEPPRDPGGMLANLRKTNPDKFQRLQERFVTPLSVGGPCPSPTFTEVQEFFKGFILCAESHSFSRHLMDRLILKISELNETVFPLNETKEEESNERSIQSRDIQHCFSSCLSNLRILAKFLGFLVFEPYYGATNPSQESQTLQAVKMRNNVAQPFDVLSFIEAAMNERRLVLTVPWVVEFLSMMDPVASYMDYYTTVFETLFVIYRGFTNETPRTHTHMLVIISLGWLFEVIPVESSFFKSLGQTSSPNTPSTYESPTHLDSSDLVDQQLLYSCYPFLGEIKTVLTESSVGLSSRSGPVKKITPVCTDAPSKVSTERRQLLTQLEENFFRIQPEFLKRMSDFITERLCSNILYNIKMVVVPSALQQGALQMENYLATTGFPQEVKSRQAKEKIRPQVLHLIHTITKEAVHKALKSIENSTKSCQIAFENLCPEDTNPKVIATASRITCRQVREKSEDWIRISLPNIMEKELFAHFDKYTNAMIHAKSKEDALQEALKQHKGESVSAALPTAHVDRTNIVDSRSLVRRLQRTLAEETQLLTTNSEEDTRDAVGASLQTALDFLRCPQRSGSSHHDLAQLGQVSLEIAFILVCRTSRQMELMKSGGGVLDSLLVLWQKLTGLQVPLNLDRLLTFPHVRLICSLENHQTTWAALSSLLIEILRVELAQPHQVETWFLVLLDYAKSQPTCQSVAKGAAEFVICYKERQMDQDLFFSSGVEFSLLLAELRKRFPDDPDVQSLVSRCVTASSVAVAIATDK